MCQNIGNDPTPLPPKNRGSAACRRRTPAGSGSSPSSPRRRRRSTPPRRTSFARRATNASFSLRKCIFAPRMRFALAKCICKGWGSKTCVHQFPLRRRQPRMNSTKRGRTFAIEPTADKLLCARSRSRTRCRRRTRRSRRRSRAAGRPPRPALGWQKAAPAS